MFVPFPAQAAAWLPILQAETTETAPPLPWWVLPAAGLTLLVVLIAVIVLRRKGPSRDLSVDPLERLKRGLDKTRGSFLSKVRNLFGRTLQGDAIEDLEELLITADFGVQATSEIVGELQQAWEANEIESGEELIERLKGLLRQRLAQDSREVAEAPEPPTVVLVAGVNGSGKTTSIAKLTHFFKSRGKKVLLAASDTFRAAAVEQLTIWSERMGVEIVKSQTGADPASVAFDALSKARARKFDILIVDTAGRLHTEKNLMAELGKIQRVLKKQDESAPHETLLVLDATTGQNALRQAEQFNETLGVTGIILTKLDGTAKGGIVVAIKSELDLPVKFIGIGEGHEDLEVFDADRFVEALFG